MSDDHVTTVVVAVVVTVVVVAVVIGVLVFLFVFRKRCACCASWPHIFKNPSSPESVGRENEAHNCDDYAAPETPRDDGDGAADHAPRTTGDASLVDCSSTNAALQELSSRSNKAAISLDVVENTNERRAEDFNDSCVLRTRLASSSFASEDAGCQKDDESSCSTATSSLSSIKDTGRFAQDFNESRASCKVSETSSFSKSVPGNGRDAADEEGGGEMAEEENDGLGTGIVWDNVNDESLFAFRPISELYRQVPLPANARQTGPQN